MPRLDVWPEAERDALDAASWYDGERLGLGSEFLTELRATFARIEASAQQYPLVFHECRRIDTAQFPSASLAITKAPRPRQELVDIHCRAGNDLVFRVEVVKKHGRPYSAKRRKFVAPHDPLVERRAPDEPSESVKAV